MDENELSQIIVDAAIEAHKTLGGPGLLESIYRDALALEIQQRNIGVEREKLVPVRYKGNLIGAPLRLDLLVGQ
jgi:GxxExxY protein